MADITCAELKKRVEEGEKLNIIDVREQNEFDEYNIGATLIPMSEFEERYNELEEFKEKELILHCRSGGRSGNAKDFLESQGYKNVKNLLGGMLAWKEIS